VADGWGFTLSLWIGPTVPLPAPQPVMDALESVQVTTASGAGAKSGFQLTFTPSKTSPILRALLPVGYFDPPTRVIITTTIRGLPTPIMDGVITRHELAPSNDPGQSKLTITGEDVSRMMELIDFSGFPWAAMPAEARVATMVAKYGMYGIVPLVVPSVMVDTPNPMDEIPSQWGTDLAYINQLADMVGYVFYVDPGPLPGMNTAYWGPEIKVGLPQPALTVDSDGASNVESLSFSFDGFAKTLFVIVIQEPNSKAPIPIPVPDVNPLQPPLGLKPPLPLKVSPLRGMAKLTPLQAGAIGLAKAAQAADVISGSGTLDVLRYGRVLKARQLVGVRGAGLSYDGLYFVKSVTHTIKRGEYKQSFSLSRNATIPFLPFIPT
jgi:hypothetical protein